MPSPLRPAVLGLDYQARAFWIEACRLFFDRRFVRLVSIEHPIVRSFDDVVTAYSSPILDPHGRELDADHYQAKFHVGQDQAIRAVDLTVPKFIGATRYSLLDRLAHATAKGPLRRRLTLLTPWRVDTSDALGFLMGNIDGEIAADRLLAGSTAEVRLVRDTWRKALGNPSDEQFVGILEHLRIEDGRRMADLDVKLAGYLERAHLAPVLPTVALHPYEALAKSFLKGPSRVRDHEAPTLELLLRREHLWIGRPEVAPEVDGDLGIKSFSRWAYDLEDDAKVLNLLPFFRGRDTLDDVDWDDDIEPAIGRFISDNVNSGHEYRLHLDAHLSIGFVAGYLLDRADSTITPVQRTPQGKRLPWAVGVGPVPDPLWADVIAEGIGEGPEVALAIEVSQPTFHDVKAYVKKELPRVGRIVRLTVAGGPSRTAVAGGAHAHALAERAGTIVRDLRAADRSELLHVFAAAPAGMFFLVGRQAAPWGRFRLYEFPGPTGAAGAYNPSFTLPPR